MPAHVAYRVMATSFIAFGFAMTSVTQASADDELVDPSMPGPVQVVAAPSSDNADPAAVAACSQFASVLDGSASYYESFAESYEGSSYSDPAVQSSNSVGRTALRESSALAMSASNTPGLRPEIADPMRIWSLGAAKLLLKMGLRIPGDSLNSTANEMNDQATLVQVACAQAGTHA